MFFLTFATCQQTLFCRTPLRLMPIHPAHHPNAGGRKYDVAEPNTLRREVAVLRLVDAYGKKRVINDQDRQKTNEKAGDELAKPHANRDRYANQHKAQTTEP